MLINVIFCYLLCHKLMDNHLHLLLNVIYHKIINKFIKSLRVLMIINSISLILQNNFQNIHKILKNKSIYSQLI
jgi:hypothetical protein